MQVDNVQIVDEDSAMERVYARGKAFLEALADWDGEDAQGAIITDLIAKHMTVESRAMFLFQALMSGHAGPDMEVTREGKVFAVGFAGMIGPDNAQWLYHFAKLVTRVA